MGRLSFLRGNGDAALRREPGLAPVIVDRWRRLPALERRRLLRTPVGLEVGGSDALEAAAVMEPSPEPGQWRTRWHVVAGRDDPPAGRWGWVIIEACVGPAPAIRRVPPTFETRAEALAAGENEAAAMWARSPAD
jgi:hypothetical protein